LRQTPASTHALARLALPLSEENRGRAELGKHGRSAHGAAHAAGQPPDQRGGSAGSSTGTATHDAVGQRGASMASALSSLRHLRSPYLRFCRQGYQVLGSLLLCMPLRGRCSTPNCTRGGPSTPTVRPADRRVVRATVVGDSRVAATRFLATGASGFAFSRV